MFFSKWAISSVAICVLLLSSCSSSSPTKVEIAEQELEVQKMRATESRLANEEKQAKMEREMESLPAWVIDPPRADKTGFYGVGTASDEDLVTSMRKATLQAKFELAATIKSELSGEDTISGSSQGDYRYIVNNFVNKVNLTGAETIERKVIPVDGEYKASILMKLPYAKFNKILQNQATAEDSQALNESYERLMQKVNK